MQLPGPLQVKHAAIAQAHDRARREGREMAVYAIYFVRPIDGSEGGCPDGAALLYTTEED